MLLQVFCKLKLKNVPTIIGAFADKLAVFWKFFMNQYDYIIPFLQKIKSKSVGGPCEL